jgi:DNA-binding transcriptional regulator YiaG
VTSEDVKRIRVKLGMNQRQLAQAIRLGLNGDRTIRRWEKGEIAVAGPASLALEYLEKDDGSKKQRATGG